MSFAIQCLAMNSNPTPTLPFNEGEGEKNREGEGMSLSPPPACRGRLGAGDVLLAWVIARFKENGPRERPVFLTSIEAVAIAIAPTASPAEQGPAMSPAERAPTSCPSAPHRCAGRRRGRSFPRKRRSLFPSCRRHRRKPVPPGRGRSGRSSRSAGRSGAAGRASW